MTAGEGWGQTPQDSTNQFAAELRERHNLTDVTLIGQGGMGKVYRAYDAGLQRWVAVKAIRPDVVATDEAYRRFATEMGTLATIRHTSVVTVHYADSSRASGTAAYFVMDYVDGGDLDGALATRREEGRRYTVAEVDRVLRPVAEALDMIHRRTPPVIHRDLKPANILLPRDPGSGAGTTAVLTDFGISIAGDDTRMTSTGTVIGTEKYMAPEIFTVASAYGAHMVDYSAATDRYALSLIALEMLTLTAFRDTMSQAAWRGERTLPRLGADNLAGEDAGAAAQITTVLRRGLDNSPDGRYPTAVAFLDALVAASRDQVGQTRAVPVEWSGTPAPSAAPAPRRRRSKAPLAVGCVVALVAALGVLGVVGYRTYASPEWEGGDAGIAAAFPDLLPERQGQEGWRGMTCDSSDPVGEEVARVTCRNDGMTMAVVDFGSEGTRSAYVPSDSTVFEAGTCRIRTVDPVEGSDTGSVFPLNAGETRYAMLVSGSAVAAASSTMDAVSGIPVC